MRADWCVLVSSVPRNDCSPIYTIKSSKSHENLHLLVSVTLSPVLAVFSTLYQAMSKPSNSERN